MTDKKTFGAFIRAKRTEKNYSQKDLADLLFVTEGAVSKWERGISYPDITLLSDLCKALDVTEHELITASTDTEARSLRHDAQKFRTIRGVWFWTPTISYAVALTTCFICNLAVNHTLSWFFIVLTALLCAFTFIPTVTGFFPKRKTLSFAVSTYLSICLLLFACAVYTGGLSWFLTACTGILIGYALVFLPILLKTRFRFVLSFAAAWALTLLLLVVIPARQMDSAMLIATYAFLPALFTAAICTLRFDGFLKAALCTALSTAAYLFLRPLVNVLYGFHEPFFAVNFHDWTNFTDGNVTALTLMFLGLLCVIFLLVGLVRKKER